MVYLAHGLRHYVPVCRNLLEALHREQINAEFLPYTSSYKHVWARDYMPIQLEKTLVFFYQYWPVSQEALMLFIWITTWPVFRLALFLVRFLQKTALLSVQSIIFAKNKLVWNSYTILSASNSP